MKFAVLVALAMGAEYSPAPQTSSDPAILNLPFSAKLGASGIYTLQWNVVGDQLYAKLNLQSGVDNPTSWPWIAIGFGRSMLDSEIVVCHSLNNGFVSIHDHAASGTHAPPTVNTKNIVTPLFGIEDNTGMTCAFKRPLKIPGQTTLDPNDVEQMIWAYNPRGVKSGDNNFFSIHSQTSRGGISVQLGTGTALPRDVMSFLSKQIHGFGMMFVWLVLFPVGAFYARFFKSTNGWLVTKITNQSLGSVAALGLALYIIKSGSVLGLLHTYSGTFVLVVMLGQITAGIMTVLGMANETLEKYRPWTRLYHRVGGFVLLASATFQIGLGINILYPLSAPRTLDVWIIYVALVVFWIAAFVLAEIVYKKKFGRSDPGFQKISSEIIPIQDKLESLKVYTWESLDEAVKAGSMLVVGNGKYVYDISQWINSHPGGQIILQAVCGTDITNDYFHESGFDATEFTPSATPLTHKESPEIPSISGLTRADVVALKRTSYNGYKAVPTTAPKLVLDEVDWQCIQKSRRTHVHTKLAIQKLASLVVGQITPSESRSIFTSDLEPAVFNPFEYRRYALTKATLESKRGAAKPFMRLRFCLLYPYDLRTDAPTKFLSGQAVEIQIRTPDGTRVSRYYTPIQGDLTAFEILVKVYPQGLLSQYLFHSVTGERQFKIRGPFGTPLFKTPQFQLENLDTIYFIAGGSGITPFLQIISEILLPIGEPLLVVQNYQPRQPDEVLLTQGDTVEAQVHFYDGWCYGINRSSRLQGYFPIGCALPLTATRLVLLNVSDRSEDIMGSAVIAGSVTAYPHLMEVVRFTSTTLNITNVAPILNTDPSTSMVIVCGPDTMNSTVVDMLGEYSGAWLANLKVFSSNIVN